MGRSEANSALQLLANQHAWSLCDPAADHDSACYMVKGELLQSWLTPATVRHSWLSQHDMLSGMLHWPVDSPC